MHIIYSLPNSTTVYIVTANSKEAVERSLGHTLTDEEYKQHVWDRSIPAEAVDPVEITVDKIPADRYFRDAWVQNTDSVEIDIEKAYEVKKDKLREVRTPLFAQLDVAYMKALEKTDSQKLATIAEKKQALRDVTILPEGLTVEELKAYTPEILNDNS